MAGLLNDDLRGRIREAISVGATSIDAAGAAGIDKSTYTRWLKRGREAIAAREQGDEPRPEDDLYVELFKDVERARQECKVEALTGIKRAGIGIPVEETRTTERTLPDGSVERTTVVIRKLLISWQANAWLLERQYPAEFALKQRMEVSGPEGGPIDIAARAARLADEAEEYLRREAET